MVAPTVPIVGRARELATLQVRLDDAARGEGSLVLLSGEAGIGKTETARAFARSARSRGAVTLWGSCFEGDWSPPYGPWVEALRQYAGEVGSDRVVRELGAGASSLAPLVPEIRALLPGPPTAGALSRDEERFRLFDAVTQLLLLAARSAPLVLVLDDLHWADPDSLRLLRHVARFLSGARILIVGTYRSEDLDLDPRHPLAGILARLRGETEYAELRIGGFSLAETAEYLARATPQKVPRALSDAIHAETAGNPFYTREVLRHLVEEGKVIRRSDRWSTDFSIGELGIPTGVRRVVAQRLLRLSEPTNRVLRLAAAFTGGFEFRVLQVLTDLPEDALLDCIDEALRAGLLRVLGGAPAAYDFAHAIVRHALYDDLNPDRRARLHRRIARALEQVYGARATERAAELAAQYHASAQLPGGEGGIPHCLAAAEQARAVHARDRAVAFLRMARDLAADASPPMRATVVSALAVAEAEALQLDNARRSIDEALALQVAAGVDDVAQAEFLAAVARALKDGGASHAVSEPLVERGLALLGNRRDLTWARLMLLRDRLETMSSGPIATGRWLGYDPRAVAIARSDGDEEDYARTLEPFDWRTRAETEAVYALARSWRRPDAILRALDVAARDCIYHHGMISTAVERLQELHAAGERYGSIPGQAEALVQLALCQGILGDVSSARETNRRAQELVARLGAMHRLRVVVAAAVASVLAYFYSGDWAALARATAEFVTYPATSRGPLGLTAASLATYNLHRSGDEAEARRFLAAITPLFERLGPTTYIYNGSLDRATATVWELGAVEYAAHYRRLARDLLARGEEGSPLRSNALSAARMAALLGEGEEAEAYFARARAVLDEGAQWPLRAIVEHDEALALCRLGSGDRGRITRLLDAARVRFAALGMDDWIERTRAQHERRSRSRNTAVVCEAYPDGLTPREAEVLRLIAAGRTNKEIASELVVSVATVQRHIANVYAKINARGRADATAYALGHRLIAARTR